MIQTEEIKKIIKKGSTLRQNITKLYGNDPYWRYQENFQKKINPTAKNNQDLRANLGIVLPKTS